jgi:predicted PurR-regulated permease PerM
MSKKIIQISFFAVFSAVLLVLLYLIFRPYFSVIFVSGVLAVSFYPIYKKTLGEVGGNKSLASFVATSLILIFIIVPLAVFSVLLLREAVGLYNMVVLQNDHQSFLYQLNAWVNNLNSLITQSTSFEIDLGAYARGILNWIIGHFGSVFAAVFGGILNFILMLLSLYYFFIYGERIKTGLVKWSPLPNEYDEDFVQTLRASMDAVFRGRILVSIAQGVFIGLGFLLFGVGSPVLWGFVGAIVSLVPILGTSLITIPAIAYLFLSGHTSAAFGLFLWAALAVGLVDNLISALFLKNKIKIHPLIVLFSILGGVEAFGVIGFLVGPVVVSAFLALTRIYPFITFNKRQETNG